MSDPRLGLPSASSMHRAALCPGSVALEAQCPPEPPGPDAERGTRIHAYIACQGTLDNEEDLEVAHTCIGMADRALVEWAGPIAAGTVINREERLWLSDAMKGGLICSGQPDIVYQQGNRALVIDYKTGWEEPDPAEVNYQLRTLAVLVAENSDGEIDEVTVLMVQPNKSREIRLVTYTADDLITAREEILGICEATKAPDALRIPGESQCRYCRGKLRCPEARQLVVGLGVASTVYAPDIEEEVVGWPADSLVRFREACLVARIMDKAVEDEMKRRLAADPDSVPGWGLADGNKRRVVMDVEGLHWAMVDEMPQEEFLACVDVKIAALEEAFVEANHDAYKTKKAAREAFRARSEPFITTHQNAPSLKRVKALPE